MDLPSRIAARGTSAQNGDVVTEVGIEDLEADLARFVEMARTGHEVAITDGGVVVARLLPAESQLLRITPAKRSPRELAGIEGVRPEKLTPQDLDDAIRWAKSDWVDREKDE